MTVAVDLTGKVAIVTGAGSGIGRASARQVTIRRLAIRNQRARGCSHKRCFKSYPRRSFSDQHQASVRFV